MHVDAGSAGLFRGQLEPSTDMYHRRSQEQGRIAAERDAVGIVVKDGGEEAPRPRAVAFVWGVRVRPAPSLPYGRWKKALTAA